MNTVDNQDMNDAHDYKLVTVVISNYNYGHFLAGAIDSVLSQSYPKIEVIVVDDASTDHSGQILKGYAGRIKVVQQPHNLGQISAYNEGFARATGAIVIFLDADDQFRPGAIATIVAAFAESEDIVKVHWRARLVDSSGQPTGSHVPSKLVAGDMSRLILQKGIMYPSPPGSANAYLASALSRIMPLPTDSSEKHGADFYTIYGIALLGKIAIAGHGEELSDYRLHQAPHPTVLGFGNAAQSYREDERMGLRSLAFQQWVSRWSAQQIRIARPLTEFSIEKNSFVNSIFNEARYLSGFKAGMAHVASLLRSIRYRPGSISEKMALTAMMLVILVLPRKAGRPIAKYICDPASR